MVSDEFPELGKEPVKPTSPALNASSPKSVPSTSPKLTAAADPVPVSAPAHTQSQPQFSAPKQSVPHKPKAKSSSAHVQQSAPAASPATPSPVTSAPVEPKPAKKSPKSNPSWSDMKDDDDDFPALGPTVPAATQQPAVPATRSDSREKHVKKDKGVRKDSAATSTAVSATDKKAKPQFTNAHEGESNTVSNWRSVPRTVVPPKQRKPKVEGEEENHVDGAKHERVHKEKRVKHDSKPDSTKPAPSRVVAEKSFIAALSTAPAEPAAPTSKLATKPIQSPATTPAATTTIAHATARKHEKGEGKENKGHGKGAKVETEAAPVPVASKKLQSSDDGWTTITSLQHNKSAVTTAAGAGAPVTVAPAKVTMSDSIYDVFVDPKANQLSQRTGKIDKGSAKVVQKAKDAALLLAQEKSKKIQLAQQRQAERAGEKRQGDSRVALMLVAIVLLFILALIALVLFL
jgi:hypothetical protein